MRPVNVEHIEKTAAEVRKVILNKIVPLHQTFDKKLSCCCAVSSVVLWRVLNKLRYRTKLVMGEFLNHREHCWVVVNDSLIVDITATQFGKFKKVEIHPISSEMYKPKFIEHAALQQFKEWAGQHRPSSYRKAVNEATKEIISNSEIKAVAA